MSNEVKTKEKVNMDPKYIIKLTVTLLLTCMVVAGLLGWVNSITKDKIAAITWEKTVAAMQKVIEADDFSDAMEKMRMAISPRLATSTFWISLVCMTHRPFLSRGHLFAHIIP